MFNTPEGNKLIRYGSMVLIVLAVFLGVQIIVSLMSLSHADQYEMKNSISVSGKGEVSIIPDVATFTFGAQETAKTVADAQKKVTEKIDSALTIVKDSGVEEKDIKTTSYNIYPHYVYTQGICTQFRCNPGTQTIDGYEVSQMIEVKVRDTDKAGTLLGDLGSVSVTNLSGLTFTVDNPEERQAEARAKAIAAAKQKAETLADDLGVDLGDVISFYDESNVPQPYYAAAAKDSMMMEQSAPSVQIPMGEGMVVSNVSITYEIHN